MPINQFGNSLWLGNNAHAHGDGKKFPILNTDRTGNELRRINDTVATGIAIDPATNRIYFGNDEGELTARDLNDPAVPIATLNPPLSSKERSAGSDMAFDGTHLWRTDIGNREVQKINPSTGEVVFSFTPTVFVLGIAWDGASLWVSEFTGFVGKERIIQFTPQGIPTGREFPAPLGGGHVGGLAFDPTDNTLWIGGIDQVHHVDTTGTLLGSFQLPVTNRFIDGLAFQGLGTPNGGHSIMPNLIGQSADPGLAGVLGEHEGKGIGVHAVSKDGVGLFASSTNHAAIHAVSTNDEALHAVSQSIIATIAAYNTNSAGAGFAIYGKKEGNAGFAGFFEGNVFVSKKLSVGDDIVLTNADCAEDFDVAGAVAVEPGTVMVLGHEGALSESHKAYDKCVAGVLSGAGDFKPGIVLDKRQTAGNRQPVALLGKVFCKVDAQFGAIEVGDLLTTSPTPGHAMKTGDPVKSIGAVIGKALRPLTHGQGLIPILIALQ